MESSTYISSEIEKEDYLKTFDLFSIPDETVKLDRELNIEGVSRELECVYQIKQNKQIVFLILLLLLIIISFSLIMIYSLCKLSIVNCN